jgi:Tfp pilus assembly protein PilN
MRAVNLLPEETSSRRRLGKPGVVPIAGTAAALLAIGTIAALAHVESGTVADKQARLDDLQQQLALVQAKPTRKASTATVTLLTSRDARIAALNSALTGRVPWELVLRQLAAVLPEDTWFDSLLMNAPVAATPADPAATPGTPATSGVTLTGYTTSPATLARVLQRLSVVTSLSDVKLTSSQRAVVGKKNLYQFTIGANIALSGGGS